MAPIHLDGLRQEHAFLSGELDVLKKAEGSDSAHFWKTLRDVCARLSAGLLEHIRKEEQLLLPHHRSLGAAASGVILEPFSGHYNDYRYLQVITRAIASEHRPFLLNSRYRLLSDFLHDLHRNMDKQEAELFPVIEQALAPMDGQSTAWPDLAAKAVVLSCPYGTNRNQHANMQTVG